MSNTTRGILLLVLLISMSPDRLHAEDSSATRRTIGSIFLDDVSIGVGDGVSFVTAPLRFTSSDWLVSAGVVGAIPILIAFDGKIQRSVQSSSTLSGWWDVPARYGAVNYGNLFAISLYGTGLLLDNDDIRITGRLLFETLTFAGASVIVARFAAGRNRPYDGNHHWDFKGFQWSWRAQSFPSGHTVVAVALSTVLAERIDTWWARVALYGLAALSAYERVHRGDHWMSDVVVGAGLSVAAAVHVLHRESERAGGRRMESRLHWQLTPGGVRLSLRL
jgi:membrane-associated phospholipid phosphatase